MSEIIKTPKTEITQQIADRIERQRLGSAVEVMEKKRVVYELLGKCLKSFENAGNGKIVSEAIHSPEVLDRLATVSELINGLTSKVRLLSNIKGQSQMKTEDGTIPFNEQNVSIAGMHLNTYHKLLGGVKNGKTIAPSKKEEVVNDQNVLCLPDEKTINSMHQIVENPHFITNLRDASRIMELLKQSFLSFLNATESGLEASVDKAIKNTEELNSILNDLIRLKKRQELTHGKITLTLQGNWLEFVSGIEKVLVDLKIEIIMFYGGDVKAILNQMDLRVMQKEVKKLKEEKVTKSKELTSIDSAASSVKRFFGLAPKKADQLTVIKTASENIDQRIKTLETIITAYNLAKKENSK